VPPSWRDLYASGQKLLREGLPPHAIPERLGITGERWREIQDAAVLAKSLGAQSFRVRPQDDRRP
jgi:hypothetical protein